MPFHNTPYGHKATEPFDPHILNGGLQHELFPPEARDGLFYRTDLPATPDELAQKILDNSSPTIQDYQYWAELGWKAEHGTYAAIDRFSGKLKEEVGELTKAVIDHYEDRDNLDILKEIVKEGGDVIWCVTALACGITADLDTGTRNLLFRYLMGVQALGDNGKFEAPRWHSQVSACATKPGQIEISDIDDIIEAGFEPLYSPAMNLFDPDEDEYDPLGHITNLVGYSMQFINGVHEQYGRDIDGEPLQYLFPSKFAELALQGGELAVQLILETAFVVHRLTRTDLLTICRRNVEKVSGRIATNTVDKTDGERQET